MEQLAVNTSAFNSRIKQESKTPLKRSRDAMLGGKSSGTRSSPILVDEDQDQNKKSPASPSKKAAKSKPKDDGGEKRLKRVRVKAPGTWLQRYDRAITQRMFLIDRQRTEVDGVPQESFELAGTTGNVYSVTIKHVPSCTCQDHRNGNICKHIIYILHLVLKAPAELEYQAAFLTSELKEIFEKSPVPKSQLPQDQTDTSGRKPVEGDCPICYMEFEPATEEIVWCKAACGNNIHKECFDKWAKTSMTAEVRCVYCRAMWEREEPSLEGLRAAKEKLSRNEEGYVNLSSELGISTYRDTSSYYQGRRRGPWY